VNQKLVRKRFGQKARARRKMRIRRKVEGTPERPRLSVFRSSRHVYAQIIDDVNGITVASASTLVKGYVRPEGKGKIRDAKAVGALVAKKALEKGIESVVFDRNGCLYHGRVKALAESAREAGLKF